MKFPLHDTLLAAVVECGLTDRCFASKERGVAVGNVYNLPLWSPTRRGRDEIGLSHYREDAC